MVATKTSKPAKPERQLMLFDRDEHRKEARGSNALPPLTDETLPGVSYSKWQRARLKEFALGIENESPF